NWHHVAATYDGFTKRIYVDGVEQNNRAIIGALIITSTTLKIGAFSNPPISHFPDLIDDVAIWNRALTAAEVFDLFN
ncbi:MAG: LamG domain-containing protein, partial [Nitrospinaceae bacterium]|nr:LamG domain-containing protein [Nitrospinaceae bacterium]